MQMCIHFSNALNTLVKKKNWCITGQSTRTCAWQVRVEEFHKEESTFGGLPWQSKVTWKDVGHRCKNLKEGTENIVIWFLLSLLNSQFFHPCLWSPQPLEERDMGYCLWWYWWGIGTMYWFLHAIPELNISVQVYCFVTQSDKCF